jgi:hypothetical protein
VPQDLDRAHRHKTSTAPLVDDVTGIRRIELAPKQTWVESYLRKAARRVLVWEELGKCFTDERCG